MMYKDKDRQREANKTAQAKRRAKKQGMTQISKGMTNNTLNVIPTNTTVTPGVIPITLTDAKAMRTVGTPDEPLTRQELIHRHKHAKASDADVQAIWDRRNQQGQPACYTSPGQPIPEAI